MNLVGENLSYKLTEELQLRKISFNFEKGKLYTILGRTLSGKTTLLKTIAGLLMPDSGTIKFEGKNFLEIPVWERNIAMVYQQFINYPHLNVFENIAFPLKQRGLDPQKINDEVFNSLKLVGLEGYEKRKIQELSGGQQQRVSVARSLVKNAKILLLDEPLVNLDYKLREQLREEFKNIFINGFACAVYSEYDINNNKFLGGNVNTCGLGFVLGADPTSVPPVGKTNGAQYTMIEDYVFDLVDKQGLYVRTGNFNISQNNTYLNVGRDGGSSVVVEPVIEFYRTADSNGIGDAGHIDMDNNKHAHIKSM